MSRPNDKLVRATLEEVLARCDRKWEAMALDKAVFLTYFSGV